MNKAVFFDRDGTLIKDKSYLSKVSDIEILDGSAEGIAMLNKLGYLVIIVTNQSGVARGYMEEKDVKMVNDALIRELSLRGARVDDFFYCPHYKGGIVPKYAVECKCRKPDPGMAYLAKEKYDIDFSQSFVVGDKESDMGLARNIGAGAILVRTGYGNAVEGECFDYKVRDVLEACALIVRAEKKKLK